MKRSLVLGVLVFLSQSCFAATIISAPQPTACISSAFSSSHKDVILTLTNKCPAAVDFQNVAVTFLNKHSLKTSFTVSFGPLSKPDNKLEITSKKQSHDKYLASFSLHFSGNSILPVAGAIQIKFKDSIKNVRTGSGLVYLSQTIASGNIQLINSSANPPGVTQAYAVVHITSGTQGPLSNVNLPWSSSQTIQGLAPDNYTLSADTVSDGSGDTWQGTVTPSGFALAANQTVVSTVSYTMVQQSGKISLGLQALPAELSGYTLKPVVSVIQSGTGSATPVTLSWGTQTTVSSLVNGSSYSFTTPDISYNGYICQPSFSPATVVASTVTTPAADLTYSCSPVAQSKITLNVNGAPSTLPSLNVTLTPSSSGSVVSENVSLASGSGSGTSLVPTGTVYKVTSDAVSGYSISFNPQPFTATDNAIESISLTPATVTGTTVSITGADFYINGVITQSSPGQKGMLPNSRMVQATFDDSNPATVGNWAYPDTHKWDPNRQTQEFVDALPTYRKAGLLAVTVNFEGGRPKSSFTSIPQPDINAGINPDGSLNPTYLARMDKVIQALDANGMVAIVGIFYAGQATRVTSDAAVTTAVENVVDWILARKYTNVMIEIANESGTGHFPTHPILQNGNIHTLITLVHTRSGGKILASASLGGGAIPPASLISAADFVLLHGDGISAGTVTSMVHTVRGMSGKPILFNEDGTSVANYKAAVLAGSSWGYYDAGKNDYINGFQDPPTNWTINTAAKKAFFSAISTL